MKRFILSFFLQIVTLCLSAQSFLSFGARGGLEFLRPKSDQTIRSELGSTGIFDLGYTYYCTTSSGDWGICTGISVGYVMNKCQFELMQQFTNYYDNEDTEVNYTVTGDVNTRLHRVFGEVPLMAAYHRKGFVLKFGLKGQYAFWSSTTQMFNNLCIDAYFVPENVSIPPNTIIGTMKSKVGDVPLVSILAAISFGNEIEVKNSGRIGIIAYLDCSIWNTATRNTTTPLISISSSSKTGVADVSINNAFLTVITRINPIQVGLSLYYAIELKSKH